MTGQIGSPRVLTMTFEFHVPQGLRANIQGKRLDAAIAKLSGAMQAMAPTVFPWADRLIVTYNWSYRWWEDREEITLPAIAENSVGEPLTPSEEEAIIAAEYA
jgi:hypothetical protein